MRLLNVGGGRFRGLPPLFDGWEQDLLDIDPAAQPDIVCDAKEMGRLPAGKYDAVYSSHMLEHFYRHDVPAVVAGFRHVLKRAGFAYVVVPDLGQVIERLRHGSITDTAYDTASGPVTFHDIFYGWHRAMQHGNLYYAHKCGFDAKALSRALLRSFSRVFVAPDNDLNLHAYAFPVAPTRARRKALGL